MLRVETDRNGFFWKSLWPSMKISPFVAPLFLCDDFLLSWFSMGLLYMDGMHSHLPFFFLCDCNTSLSPHKSSYNGNPPCLLWTQNLTEIIFFKKHSTWVICQLSAHHMTGYSHYKFRSFNTFAKSTRNWCGHCPSKVNSFLTPKYVSRAWFKV